MRDSIIVDDAISYATRYATSPNRPTYYFFDDGDCTNFVSQILENAGVLQEVYTSTLSGWWHKRTTILPGILYNHTHSQSWTLADVFCRYMGICFQNTSALGFSSNIHAGSIVGADFAGDGEWDHTGFITATQNTVGEFGYFDFKVAQHTSNYNAWASSDTNNWDNIGNDGGWYCRVRE